MFYQIAYGPSVIAIDDENEYSEFPRRVLYEEMKLHLFSFKSYTSQLIS